MILRVPFWERRVGPKDPDLRYASEFHLAILCKGGVLVTLVHFSVSSTEENNRPPLAAPGVDEPMLLLLRVRSAKIKLISCKGISENIQKKFFGIVL